MTKLKTPSLMIEALPELSSGSGASYCEYDLSFTFRTQDSH